MKFDFFFNGCSVMKNWKMGQVLSSGCYENNEMLG